MLIKNIMKYYLFYQKMNTKIYIYLPNDIQLLSKHGKIRLLFIKEDLTKKSILLITLKLYKNNPILIINNKCKFPKGWLRMFIYDHQKYPNDAIAASIQYYIGKNLEIKEFSEGYKGTKFGTFNHITEMIFNFALINSDLGGILYPKNFFKNNDFFDENLYLKLSNDFDNLEDFYESVFIIIEDKILRQSSKIFDYTKYLLLKDINYEEYYKNKIESLEKMKKNFFLSIPKLEDAVKKRQNKIIVFFIYRRCKIL